TVNRCTGSRKVKAKTKPQPKPAREGSKGQCLICCSHFVYCARSPFAPDSPCFRRTNMKRLRLIAAILLFAAIAPVFHRNPAQSQYQPKAVFCAELSNN